MEGVLFIVPEPNAPPIPDTPANAAKRGHAGQVGVPSGTNLLGLIQHLTGVEVHWFQRVFLGEEAP